MFCLDISVFSHGLTNVEKENHNLLLVVSTFAGNPRKCGGRRPSWRPVPGTLNNCLHTTNSHPCPPPPCCPSPPCCPLPHCCPPTPRCPPPSCCPPPSHCDPLSCYPSPTYPKPTQSVIISYMHTYTNKIPISIVPTSGL